MLMSFQNDTFAAHNFFQHINQSSTIKKNTTKSLAVSHKLVLLRSKRAININCDENESSTLHRGIWNFFLKLKANDVKSLVLHRLFSIFIHKIFQELTSVENFRLTN